MKTRILSLTLAFSLVAFSAFASGEDKISGQALRSFQKQFATAQNISWRVIDGVNTADFTLNGLRLEAYFDNSGEFIGTARNILFNQLPIAVISSIDKTYGEAPVYEIMEYNFNGETFYRMNVEVPGKKLAIRSSLSGEISVERKIKIS